MQLRDYRIRAGRLDQFVAEWRAGIVPLRQRLGFSIEGAWTVPDESRILWILSYPGDEAAFATADAAYYASPERKALDPNPARLIEAQAHAFLRPVDG